jgi:REP element-mobilizing transposase RayT
MARPLRSQPAGEIFHVVARGVRREALFRDRLDHVRHLEILGESVARFGWRCLGWAQLTNHFHLLVRLVRDDSLSPGMHRANWMYARRFNERYGFSGHVFERRFHAEHVQREEHLFEALRYIALNPARAGLCRDPAEWEWSSFRATARIARAPAFLAAGDIYDVFGGGPARAAERYAAFVRAGIDDPAAADDVPDGRVLVPGTERAPHASGGSHGS